MLTQSKIIGHSSQLAEISQLIANDRMPNSIVISGDKGIGKSVFANVIAEQILKSDIAIATDCLVLNSNKSSIGIDAIRDANEFLVKSPTIGKNRVVIMDKADALTINAANALLKSLEEPKNGRYIILVSESLDNILPTIKSRCYKIALRPLSQEEVGVILKSHNISENLLEIVDGSQGLAIWLKENDADNIAKNISDFFDAIIVRDNVLLLKIASLFPKDKLEIIEYIMLSMVRLSVYNKINHNRFVTKNYEVVFRIAQNFKIDELMTMHNDIMNYFSKLNNFHLDIKHVIIILCHKIMTNKS
jgi:DNA polymerase III subunit delta'